MTAKSSSNSQKIAKAANPKKAKVPKPATDMGRTIAQLVVEKYFRGGKHLIYVMEQFWVYQSGVWRACNDREIEGKVLAALEGIEVSRQLAPLMKQVVELLKPMCTVAANPFRHPKYDYPVINCRNGEVHLLLNGKLEFLKHRSTSYFDHRMDVNYQPLAKCPLYSKALLDIFNGSKQMRQYWHEVTGYALQESREFAVVFVLFGSGANGKTMLIKTLLRLFGPSLVYAGRVDELGKDPWAVAHFDGKRVFVDDDVASDTVLPDGMLKKISEDKILTGELKFQNKREVECRVVPFLLCNNIPELCDMSSGTLRRLQVIPFQRSFLGSNQDVGLFPRIWDEEMSGVLNRMLKGYQRLRKRGRFDIPVIAQDATKKWIVRASLEQRFVEDCCVIRAEAKTWGNDLYRALREFAKDEGVRSVPERARFYADLGHQGFKQIKGRQGQRFIGVALKQVPSAEPDKKQ